MDELERERETAAQARPNPLLVQRAADLNSMGRHDLARDFAHRALALEPRDPHAMLQLALAHLGQDQTREAERIALEAVAIAPELAFGHGILSLTRNARGHFAQAERDVLEALRLDPDEPFLYRTYARLLLQAGQTEKAERLTRRSLEIQPEDENAEALLAMILAERGRKGAALHHGQRSLALAPEQEGSHLAMGRALLEHGHPFRARRHFREALRIEPGPELEEAYLTADRCCRVVYLPMYWWSQLIERLPGRNIGAWALFMAFVFGGPRLGVSETVVGVVALSYVAFCIYTWISSPLVQAWIRLRPPR